MSGWYALAEVVQAVPRSDEVHVARDMGVQVLPEEVTPGVVALAALGNGISHDHDLGHAEMSNRRLPLSP
jgi:hypothetical protein